MVKSTKKTNIKIDQMKKFSIILFAVLLMFGLNVKPLLSLDAGAEFFQKNQLNIVEERFIVRLYTEDERIIQDAWITLKVAQRDENELRDHPPLYYEFTHENGRIYSTDIISHRLADKIFTLTVQAEGYETYRVSFEHLNKDVTVRLRPN